MPKCTQSFSDSLQFGRIGRKRIEANFNGGDLSSDGGLLLLKAVDDAVGLTRAAAAAVKDRRDPDLIEHPLHTLLSQRIFGICCGYEDLNDHAALRLDGLMQTAVSREGLLACAPTLCRLENAVKRSDCTALSGVLIDQFINAHTHGDGGAPEQIVLDVDASDIPLHGDQEGRQFHGYYDSYCYLPLYVFCGDHLLAAYLRNSRIDGAKNVTALIKVLVRRIRQTWPEVRIIVRGDSGFCRQRLLRWCEKEDVGYVIGLARNARLHQQVEWIELDMKEHFEATGEKQREIGEFVYAADSWDTPRRVVTRLEYGPLGINPRFIVTNLPESSYDANALYDGFYCKRGEAENRIKEAQLDLFGTRASCHRFLANQFRLLLSALAYTLMQALTRRALEGTELARATSATIRCRLLKIGASIMKNTRRIVLMLASNHPLRDIFEKAARRLMPNTPESAFALP